MLEIFRKHLFVCLSFIVWIGCFFISLVMIVGGISHGNQQVVEWAGIIIGLSSFVFFFGLGIAHGWKDLP